MKSFLRRADLASRDQGISELLLKFLEIEKKINKNYDLYKD